MIQIDLQKAYDMVNWGALESIMKEIGIPRQFIHRVMTRVTTMSYKFNIMGEFTSTLLSKRGIRQGDPISPLLFVLIMEYLNKLMEKMQRDPNFNHHDKCEKVKLTNLILANDILLYCGGGEMSMQMMLNTMDLFFASTCMVMDPNKCKIYFGGLNNDSKDSERGYQDFKKMNFHSDIWEFPQLPKANHKSLSSCCR